MLSHISPQNIVLNSNYATSKNSYGNRCSFELSKSILIPNNVVAYVSLNHFKYTNVFYNVTEAKNIFYYSFNGGVTVSSITIPVGNYSVSTLITALNSAGFTFTYSRLTFRILITNSTPFVLLNGENDISRVLGYESFITPVTSYSCPNAINLLGSQLINVQLQGINIGTTQPINGITGVLEAIPINVSATNSYSFTPNTSNEYRVNNLSITTIYINLIDETNANLNMLGSTFYISLHLRFLYPNDVRAERTLADVIGEDRKEEDKNNNNDEA